MKLNKPVNERETGMSSGSDCVERTEDKRLMKSIRNWIPNEK